MSSIFVSTASATRAAPQGRAQRGPPRGRERGRTWH